MIGQTTSFRGRSLSRDKWLVGMNWEKEYRKLRGEAAFVDADLISEAHGRRGGRTWLQRKEGMPYGVSMRWCFGSWSLTVSWTSLLLNWVDISTCGTWVGWAEYKLGARPCLVECLCLYGCSKKTAVVGRHRLYLKKEFKINERWLEKHLRIALMKMRWTGD